MKKLILFILLLFPLTSVAQNYEAQGDKAYTAGDYSEAKVQFEAALALLQANKVNENSQEYLLIQRKLTRAEICIPLKEKADGLYAAAQTNNTEAGFTSAKTAYQAILSQNSSDRSAKAMVLECDRAITAIATNKADEALWAQVTSSGGLAAYKAYLAEFPTGLHASEARDQMLRLEDEQLWLAAKSEGSVEAYNNYISQSKTRDYVAKAEYEICAIQDAERWSAIKDGQDEEALKAYISDTSSICKQHLAQANAYLSVIRTKRYAASSTADARQIVRSLSSAQNTIVLDEDSKRILEEKRAVVDYEDFIAHPTIRAGEKYLARYPEGVGLYREAVSDKVAKLYADNFSTSTLDSEYSKAMGYAKSDTARKYVKEKYASVIKKRKTAHRQEAWADRWQFGIGIDMEFVNNFVWGPRLEFRIGSAEDVFNFSVGAKYYMWNTGSINVEDGSSPEFYRVKLGATQVPVFATLKFNLADVGRNNVCKLYLAAEGAYNFNLNAKFKAPDFSSYWASTVDTGYYPGLWQGERIADKNLIVKNNITAGLRLGFNWRRCDFGIYGKYDLTPMFAAEYAASTEYCEYQYIEQSVTGRFRIGVNLIWYIIL